MVLKHIVQQTQFFYKILGRAGRRIRRFEFYISPGDPGAGVYRYSKVKHVYLWKQIKKINNVRL